jgi:hypothetical protein
VLVPLLSHKTELFPNSLSLSTASYKNIFEIKDNINKFMVSCNSPAEREEWLSAFATAKDSFTDSGRFSFPPCQSSFLILTSSSPPDGTKSQKSLNKTQSVRMVSLKKKKSALG